MMHVVKFALFVYFKTTVIHFFLNKRQRNPLGFSSQYKQFFLIMRFMFSFKLVKCICVAPDLKQGILCDTPTVIDLSHLISVSVLLIKTPICRKCWKMSGLFDICKNFIVNLVLSKKTYEQVLLSLREH